MKIAKYVFLGISVVAAIGYGVLQTIEIVEDKKQIEE
jgi:hypothetical protein